MFEKPRIQDIDWIINELVQFLLSFEGYFLENKKEYITFKSEIRNQLSSLSYCFFADWFYSYFKELFPELSSHQNVEKMNYSIFCSIQNLKLKCLLKEELYTFYFLIEGEKYNGYT